MYYELSIQRSIWIHKKSIIDHKNNKLITVNKMNTIFDEMGCYRMSSKVIWKEEGKMRRSWQEKESVVNKQSC